MSALQHETLIDLLSARIQAIPSKLAYEFVESDDSEITLTYAQLDQKARALAAHFINMGLTGQRALLLYAPSMDYVTAFWGCLYAGVVAVPVYPPDPTRLERTLPRLMAIIEDCDAHAILSTTAIQSFGGDQIPGQWVTTDSIDASLANNWKRPNIGSDSLAFLQYTSGSTGNPKGVMLTHHNLLAHAEFAENDLRLDNCPRSVSWLPPYHDMGLIGGILQPVYSKFIGTLMSPIDFLSNPYKWLKLISDRKGYISAAPNFAYDLCVRRITPEQRKTLDLSTWKFAVNGAEPIKFDTMQRFADYFEPCGFKMETFFPCYGLAEGTLYVCGGAPSGTPKTKGNFVSCGPIKAPVQIEIRDGEVCVKNNWISQGYYQKPEINQNVFRDFLYTGDLGFIEDGELYITGRKKDLIIIRGRNYYPQDIEASVERASPNIRKGCVAAVGLNHAGVESLGVVAEVSDLDKSHETFEAIKKRISLDFDLRVEKIKLIPAKSIPKTSSGKIQRYAAREMLLADEVHASNTGSIRSILGLEPETPLDEDQPLVSFGLDSLMRQELLATLNLPADTPISDKTTLRDLSSLRAERSNPSWITASPLDPRNDEGKPWSIDNQLAMLNAAGLQNPFFILPSKECVINFSNYNYVGLAGHKEISDAACASIREYGTSVSASRLVSGERLVHEQLERKIADFIGVEDAIVYVSGHATNVSTIGHLFGPGDLILHDSLAHNSILEGCKLSGARAMPFAHNDPNSCALLLAEHRSRYNRALIIIEGVYSMDGDIPDLARFVELKKKHGTHLYVDEAHSIGALGQTGRGLSEHAGVDPKEVDFWMGTLSKSLASCGGYIAGSHAIIKYLKYTSPSFVYSVGISPANAAASLKALEILEREPQRLDRLRANSKLFLELAEKAGLNTGLSQHSAVIPIMIGDSMKTLALSQRLLTQGINIRPIIYPAVEDHLSRLRVFMTSEHTPEQIKNTIQALVE